MATKEELYISINQSNYIKNKSNLLRCQEDMLNAMKHLYNIKVLTRLKNDLKNDLQKLSGSIKLRIDSIQKNMPTSNLPKNIKHKAPAEKPKQQYKMEIPSETWDIESELRTIQEKLQKLNS